MHRYIYIYIYMCICISLSIYIYIYIWVGCDRLRPSARVLRLTTAAVDALEVLAGAGSQ